MYYNKQSHHHSEKDKHSSRSRSRNNNKHHHHKRRNSKSSSSDNNRKHKKKQEKKNSHSKDQKKRLRFAKDEKLQDIKCFIKEDQPNAKPLSQHDLIEYKRKLDVNSSWYTNATFGLTSQQIKHRQSLMEGQSMKLQKQREKNMNEKILLVRQEIQYYIPYTLKLQNYQQKGQFSTEKDTHNARINSKLGCFYSRLNQIPDEPDMSTIQNNVASKQPAKNIMFEKPTEKDRQQISKFVKNQEKEKKIKQQKPLKGILKKSLEEIRKMRQRQIQSARIKQQQLLTSHKIPGATPNIDLNLLNIVKDITINKSIYTPQMIQNLLRPYKYNGSLQKVIKYMKQREITKPNPIQNHPVTSSDPMRALSILEDMNKKGMPNNSAISLTRLPLIKPQFGNVHNPMMMIPPTMPMMSNDYKNDKYRTVPCKYFHGPQGCQRRTDCTFIHDQMYPGRPTPQMIKMHPISMNPPPIFNPNPQNFLMKGNQPPPPPLPPGFSTIIFNNNMMGNNNMNKPGGM